MWAHSVNGNGRRHGLVEHLRATGALARRFAEPFGAGELAEALGLLHDAGKADCLWQQRLLTVEGSSEPVRRDHKQLGARMLAGRAGPAAMAVLGHHGGLGCVEELRCLLRGPMGEAEAAAESALRAVLPEVPSLVAGPSLPPAGWRTPLVFEMGLRLTFSALVDADHLDTAAHFAGLDGPQVAPAADMVRLLRRFESERAAMLAARAPSPVDGLRAQLYRAAVDAAAGPAGLYRLPAPTGSGKTMTAAAFGLHHAAVHGKSRVIVAVPFITVTEQNAEIYRTLLGADAVLEHHSAVELDDRHGKLGAENWDAPFVVTTTVQLFDSLFGRKPARSRKLHRLANAVIVLDEVQSLPVPLLVPILDALRLLAEHFGTTALLASATQPAFEHLAVWREQHIRTIVTNPELLYEQLRRVRYEWWLNPRPRATEVADRVAGERQALVVVNTTADAREMFRLVRERSDGPIRHLSTRMCPLHRQAVLADVRGRLDADEPIVLVSTQLIEAGVDLDFPVVYRALAPADSLQQAAGRANREGRRPTPGRIVVFDAEGAGSPATYRVAVAETTLCFGPDRADPDDLAALASYYRRVYDTLNTDHGKRATTIQERRAALDFTAVADGPLRDSGESKDRDRAMAFRMLDDETVPVVVTAIDHDVVAGLLDEFRRPVGALRETLRALQPYTVALPRRVLEHADVRALCAPVRQGSELLKWRGPYDPGYGIDETDLMQDMIT